MSEKLQKLTLKGFRGATRESTLHFLPDKKVTMIFGENGSGKSTIVDAFSFLCEGSLGSVRERSGTKTSHVVAVGSQSGALSVSLTTDKGTWTARLSGSNPVVTPQTPLPSVRVLRRSTILKVIEAQPKPRFETLKSFIDLSGIENSENALRNALDQANRDLDQITRNILQAEDGLKGYWESEGKPDSDSIKWAETIVAQDASTTDAQKKVISTYKTALEAARNSAATLEERRVELEAAVKTASEAATALKDAQNSISEQSSDMLEVLQSAQKFIAHTDPLENCPVCSQSVDRNELAANVEQRIQSMASLKTAHANALKATRSKDTADSGYKRQLTDCAKKVRALAGVHSTNLPECLKKLDLAGVNLVVTDASSDEEIVKQIASLLPQIPQIIQTLDTEADSLGSFLTRQKALKSFLQQIKDNRTKQVETERILSGLAVALPIVEGKRKEFVRLILHEISDEVDKLYLEMHPNESLGGLKLILRENVKGSLELQADFHSEKEIPPQAYFSESHLDTLGLCIFLALAKKYKTQIIILDDVVTSVDATHLERFIRLIDREADHFDHVVLTTHYRPWRDQYRYHQQAGAKMTFVELRNWTLNTGIYIHSDKLAIDELEHYQKPEHYDRQITAQKAGILLEGILHCLTLKYKTSVPHKQPPLYTLGELLSSISKVAKTIKIERYDEAGVLQETIDLKDTFETIYGLVWIRNQVGAHFNVVGQEVSDSQVQEFAHSTLQLARILTCPQSGSIPHKNEGSCWASAKKRTRMYPLTQPGASV
jgi:energy-coupling factor transporter ATP-binding protein EcfA2